ncbi:MAG: hypothetical protein HC894_29585 [Microcoleus sp. SM1_3_4]|nr:hypothetical protein [Microcoleus sp. SM1_3_4]
MGVQEVWFWEDGLFTLYNLGADGYDRISRSVLVPELDFDLLTGVRVDELYRGGGVGI